MSTAYVTFETGLGITSSRGPAAIVLRPLPTALQAGAFYPFVPARRAQQQRDNMRELRLSAKVVAELPVELELDRWFPLGGSPI